MYRSIKKKVAQIRIAGPDQKGIIAAITRFLFEKGLNIEDIDQRIHEGYLIMNMLVDTSNLKGDPGKFQSELAKAAKAVGTQSQFIALDKPRLKKTALLVTKESHCLLDLIKAFKAKKLKGEPVCVIANHPDLKAIAEKHRLPFHLVPAENRKAHEEGVLKLLADYEVDLVVLARYMQILSPEFVFRHEGRIINIHPSLLPSFPGPRSYHQAFHKGVEWVGVTSHFVTTNLDEGPIIAQEAFRIDPTADDIPSIIKRGQELEAKCLTRAVKLFLEDRLTLRRGRVIDLKKEKVIE